MNRINNLSGLFTYPLKLIIENQLTDINFLQEIRLRADKPLMVTYKGREYFVRHDGSLSEHQDDCIIADIKMLNETIQVFCSYSLYAFEEEVRQGFLTIPGGHRVGICGKVVVEEHNVKTIKNISSINVRMAHEVKGCADEVMKHIYESENIYSTLIVSPPGAGKTTLLRDIIRKISDGNHNHSGVNVGVVDERSEIAACYKGIPQNDVGSRTDVLDCCPKREGMIMLLRSMAPKVIAVDEIGDKSDYDALHAAFYCGCKIVATVHGSSYEELLMKPMLKELIGEGIFERFVFLKAKEVHRILDRDGKIINEVDIE